MYHLKLKPKGVLFWNGSIKGFFDEKSATATARLDELRAQAQPKQRPPTKPSPSPLYPKAPLLPITEPIHRSRLQPLANAFGHPPLAQRRIAC